MIRTQIALPLFSLLYLTTACAGDDPGASHGLGETGLLQAWALGPGIPPRAPIQVHARIEAPEDLAGWRVVAEESWVTPAPDSSRPDARALWLEGGFKRRVFMPGPFDPSAFNRVRVALKLQDARPCQMHLHLWRGQEAVVSRSVFLPPTNEPQATVVDFPENALGGEVYDAIQIELRTMASVVGLFTTELIDEPLEHWLPDPAGPEEFVTLSEDTRPAVGLAVGRSLLLQPRVPAGATHMEFAFGVPTHLLPEGIEARLRLGVRSGDETLQGHSWPLDPAQRGTWQRAVVALEGRAQADLQFELDLITRGGHALVCAVTDARLYRPLERAPTVLLVTSDTHRGDHLGAARSGVSLDTPVLDELAAQGVLFEDCWTSTNVTTPSHVALMTATSPRDTGVFDNLSRLGPDAPTLARAFRAAGYSTFAAVSTLHLRQDSSGLAQGFDRLSAPTDGEWTAERSVDRVLSWLPEAQGRPLFLWLHVFDAHTPYEPPAEFDRRYYPADRDPTDPALPDPKIPSNQVSKYLRGIRDLEFPRSQYRAEISYLDQELGRLLEVDRIADGIVAVTSDHGESLGAHGTFFNHHGLFPDTLHVPLLLRWPDAQAGKRVSRHVRQIDIGRTLLNLSGLEELAFPGVHLAAEEGSTPTNEPHFAVASGAVSASVLSDGWLFILHLKDQGTGASLALEHSAEMFDIATDRDCLQDLVMVEPERARRMRTSLIAWLGAARTDALGGRAKQDARMLEHLKDLGYATSEAEPDARALFDPECACRACALFSD